MVFGTPDRSYELLESADKKNPLKHDFECRLDNSPNDTFFEFSLNADPRESIDQLFARALRQSQEETFLMGCGGPQSPADREVQRHLEECLSDAIADYPYEPFKAEEDFTKAVEQMSTQETGLEK